MAKLFANSGDSDQTPHSVVPDLGLQCLPITILGISRLKWFKYFRDTDETADEQYDPDRKKFESSLLGEKNYTTSISFEKSLI